MRLVPKKDFSNVRQIVNLSSSTKAALDPFGGGALGGLSADSESQRKRQRREISRAGARKNKQVKRKRNMMGSSSGESVPDHTIKRMRPDKAQNRVMSNGRGAAMSSGLNASHSSVPSIDPPLRATRCNASTASVPLVPTPLVSNDSGMAWTPKRYAANSMLRNVFAILKFEYARQPKKFGACVMGYDDMFLKFRDFREAVERQRQGESGAKSKVNSSASSAKSEPYSVETNDKAALGPRKKVYFVSVDVEKCFDNINLEQLMRLLQELLREDECVLKFGWCLDALVKVIFEDFDGACVDVGIL